MQRQMQRLFLTKISTVHGFCSDLLREYAYKLDIAADFRVADENECREIRETVLEGLLDRAYETAGMTRTSGRLWTRRAWGGQTVRCRRSSKRSTTAPTAT